MNCLRKKNCFLCFADLQSRLRLYKEQAILGQLYALECPLCRSISRWICSTHPVSTWKDVNSCLVQTGFIQPSEKLSKSDLYFLNVRRVTQRHLLFSHKYFQGICLLFRTLINRNSSQRIFLKFNLGKKEKNRKSCKEDCNFKDSREWDEFFERFILNKSFKIQG